MKNLIIALSSGLFGIVGCVEQSKIDGSPSSPADPAPVAVSVAEGGLQASTGRILGDGSIVVELSGFTVSEPVGVSDEIAASFREEYEGRLLKPGEYVPVAMLVFSPGFSAPTLLAPGENEQSSATLIWHHPVTVTDPADTLCGGEEVKGVCGVRWVREEIRLSNTSREAFSLQVESLDVKAGGRLEFALTVTSFELHDASGRTNYCCGNLAAATNAEFDNELVVQIDESAGWIGSFSCGYDDLKSVPQAADCPASW